MTPTERTRKLASIPLAEASGHHEWLRVCFKEELAERLTVRKPGSFYEEFENIYHCALLLHLVADLEDLPLLYSAKCSGDMDLGSGFDWQFVFVREPETLKDWAKSVDRADIAQWVEDYEQAYRDEDMKTWLDGVIRYHRPAQPDTALDPGSQ